MRVFPTRYKAEKVCETLHVSGASLCVRRLADDQVRGWVIAREDWSMPGVELYLADGGRYEPFMII